MKLKIISDGTNLGTRVVNADTGEPVSGIQSIKFEIKAGATVQFATIEIAMWDWQINVEERFINQKALVMK